MYCSTCGKQINDNLNYCSGCGHRIEKNPLVVGNQSSGYFAYAAGFIGVGGLIGAFAILKILLESRLDPPAIIIIFAAYLLTVLVLFSVLVGHIWKHSGDIRIKAKANGDDDYAAPTSFRSPSTSELGPATDFGISVTENTTRTLDEIPIRSR